MSAASVLGVADAKQSRHAVSPQSEVVNPPAATPLDADTAAADPSEKLLATEVSKTSETPIDDVSVMTTPRSATATTKRKTCILKLDGCHYTIGKNALLNFDSC